MVDKGEACGEVNGASAISVVTQSARSDSAAQSEGLSSPRPPAYHPDKLTPADRRGRWSGGVGEGGAQILTYHKTGTPGTDHCSVDSS